MAQVRQHELGQVLLMTLRDFRRRLDEDLAANGFPGVRYRHRSVFMHLDRHGASRSADLAAAAGIRPQSMMKIVHELERLGFVTRREDPDDSRAKLIEFTATGERLIQQLSTSTERVWRQYADLLGEERLQAAMDTLNTLQNMNGEVESA